MPIRMIGEKPGKSTDIIHISVLLAIALCIGIYLIGTAVLISKDGVTFIEYAKNLEVAPCEAMKGEYQHPGYPFLILTAHRIAKIVYGDLSLWSWIYSAQVVTLIFRLLAVAALYLVGKEIVGPRFSFWAILILILLPTPARFGSDALSDWPHIFFLAAGFLLLIRGAMGRKWWLFGFAGLAAGMGYLVRPECAQLAVFGSLWSGLQLFWPKRTVSKLKVVFAFALLLAGFLVAAGPYMKLKGGVFPKKQIVRFALDVQSCEVYEQETQICSNIAYTADFVPLDIARALDKLAERVGGTLMWFFVPALLVGVYKYFREQNWREPKKFFITALIALNMLLMILLYCNYGYMSGRHTLTLVVFTIFYVPAGLQMLATLLQGKFSKKTEQSPVTKADKQFWFLVLLVIGISICTPKLLTPIRAERQSYRDAAQWLARHTNENDIIAVPDIRISFYSGRKGVQYDGQAVPKEAQYIVRLFKDEKDMLTNEEMLQVEKLFPTGGDGKRLKVAIYRQAR